MTKRTMGLDTWCILRTTGPRTIALARSLCGAGVEAWTPVRTFKRPRRPTRLNEHGRALTIEVDAPILPTVAFARYSHVHELVVLASMPISPHPAFSIFRHNGNIPGIADRSLAGLRREEEFQAELLARMRECEAHEDARLVRAALLKTEKARRKAMRMEVFNIPDGTSVTVRNAPAMAGLSGVIESSDGRNAEVVFGGVLRMTIETWQLVPDIVTGQNIAA